MLPRWKRRWLQNKTRRRRWAAAGNRSSSMLAHLTTRSIRAPRSRRNRNCPVVSIPWPCRLSRPIFSTSRPMPRGQHDRFGSLSLVRQAVWAGKARCSLETILLQSLPRFVPCCLPPGHGVACSGRRHHAGGPETMGCHSGVVHDAHNGEDGCWCT